MTILLACIAISYCINRNIVECKVENKDNMIARLESINRNIVECKEGDGENPHRTGSVLIETSWNVKKGTSKVGVLDVKY